MENEIDDNSPGEFDNVRFKSISNRTKLTFFYEKKDGSVFASEEQEAANGKYYKLFTLLGWSNGQTYFNFINKKKLKKGQVIQKEEAEKLLHSAFDAELKVAKKNMKEAKENNLRIPRPQRLEWAFDSSVPLKDRSQISGGHYNNATMKYD